MLRWSADRRLDTRRRHNRASVRSATRPRSSMFGPRAFRPVTSVTTNREQPSCQAFQNLPEITAVGLPSRDRAADVRPQRFVRPGRPPPCHRARRSPAPGIFQRRRPDVDARAAGRQRSLQRLVVPYATGQLHFDVGQTDDRGQQVAVGTTAEAASNPPDGSTRRRRCQVIAASSAEPYSVSLPALPCTRRTTRPSTTSTAATKSNH